MSSTQQFLVAATRSVGSDDCFRWDAVGTSLGLTAARADEAVRSLHDRKLVLLLRDGEARLLDAGRQLAARLEAKGQTGGAQGRAAPSGAGAPAGRGR